MSHGTMITIVDPAGYVKQAMAIMVRGSVVLHPWHDCKDFDPAGHI